MNSPIPSANAQRPQPPKEKGKISLQGSHPTGSRPGSRMGASSPGPPSESDTALGQLIDGRTSPSCMEDDRQPSGFSKVKGNRAINTPAAPIHVDRRYFPRDMRGLLEIYEQGVSLQKGMQSHCKEATDALDGLASNCEITVKSLLNQMEAILYMMQQQVEKPANVDWAPVLAALAKLDDIHPEAVGKEVERHLADHRIKMTELEERMEEKLTARILGVESAARERDASHLEEFAQLHEEVISAQRLAGDVGNVVKHAAAQLTQVVDEQHRALKSDFSQTVQDVLRLQEKTRRADLAKLEPQLQLQLTHIVEEPLENLRSDVSERFQEVLDIQDQHVKQIADIEPSFRSHVVHLFDKAAHAEQAPRAQIKEIHKLVHDDVAHLFNEIGLVQRALNLDYVAKPRRAQTAREGTRLREIWTQTEGVSLKEGAAQTDETGHYRAHRKKDDKKKLQVPKAQAVPPPPKPFVKKKSGFADQEKKKAKMREALIKPSYNVANYYHTTGCAQTIARSQTFENVTFFFILINAIWIAVDTDYNDAVVLIDAKPLFQIIENSFCTYFTLELLIRFLAFRKKKFCLRDMWFCFDTLLVLGMIIETWVISVIILTVSPEQSGERREASASGVGNFSILRMARMVKMLRMARMARILRMVPELVMILKSIGAAFRSVGFFLLLAAIIIYVFAVGFRQITKNSKIGDKYFKSVPEAMNSLLLEGMLPIYSIIVRDVSAASPWYWPLIMAFIIFASVTVLNMLIGVLVEVVRTVAEREREAMAVIHVTNELRTVMHEFITDRGGSRIEKERRSYAMNLVKSVQASEREKDDIPDMTKDVLESFLIDPQVCSLLGECGVDALALLDSIDMIWEEKVKLGARGLQFVDFVEVVLNLRGTNPATVKDIKEQNRAIKAISEKQAAQTNEMFTAQMAKLRMDMTTQITELRKVVDSECGSDAEVRSAATDGENDATPHDDLDIDYGQVTSATSAQSLLGGLITVDSSACVDFTCDE